MKKTVASYKVYFENIVRKAEKDGKTIGNVSVKFMRSDSSSLRPNELKVTFTIDGKQETRFFENKAGGGQ